MLVEFHRRTLTKRFPLRISRGWMYGSENLFVSVADGSNTGWGECAPGGDDASQTADAAEADLRGFLGGRFGGTGGSGGGQGAIELPSEAATVDLHDEAIAAGVPGNAVAALDIALWDLAARRAGVGLNRLLGLARRSVPTSLTIGINPPEVVAERVPLLLDGTGARALKVKLGSPDGLDADKDMYAAVVEAAVPWPETAFRVDANGGWSLDEARLMIPWLAERGVEYVEQPLVRGAEDELAPLFAGRPVPIYVDESCHRSPDVTLVADRVDGVNLKLMKCGGITEALRIVATARAHGLSTMIGCMGESSVSIAAGASIAALFDHVDLDAHLNLEPDPADGAPMVEGVVLPAERPGHGGRLVAAAG